MKGRFAKIIELEGHQVLIRAAADSEGNPAIIITMQTNDGFIDVCTSFESDNKGAGLRERDKMLAHMLDDDDDPIPRQALEDVRAMGKLDNNDKPIH